MEALRKTKEDNERVFNQMNMTFKVSEILNQREQEIKSVERELAEVEEEKAEIQLRNNIVLEIVALRGKDSSSHHNIKGLDEDEIAFQIQHFRSLTAKLELELSDDM